VSVSVPTGTGDKGRFGLWAGILGGLCTL